MSSARITSAIFVAQLTRRLFVDGSFAAVLRTGASEAGAIYVLARGRDGVPRLFSPAVQTLVTEDGTRRFSPEPAEDEAAIEARFDREARFDPDFWVVEIETDAPEQYLDIVEA